MNEKVAFPNALKYAFFRDLHFSHPVSWGIVGMAQQCYWQYMNSNLLVFYRECKLSTLIGKNQKSIILAKQNQAHDPRIVPNQEIQIDISGPMKNEKNMKSQY